MLYDRLEPGVLMALRKALVVQDVYEEIRAAR